ncbi:MAG: hypothetical protein GC188_10245 [Alphaproteobacteria bacterium]|nr:hypothetical protein [Alphaproteobacteria bacterium]
MGLFLFRFWPVLIPLLVYLIWHAYTRRKALKSGQTPPRFRDGPWFWIVLLSLGTGFACFVSVAMMTEPQKGDYQPPHMENGVLVPGRVVP